MKLCDLIIALRYMEQIFVKKKPMLIWIFWNFNIPRLTGFYWPELPLAFYSSMGDLVANKGLTDYLN